ncbi:MAG: hypothetical protein IPJ39_11030 [Saprospiraceae bacterium]|nr:hypothetical protein [Saprospiraceae bacterium]
MTNPEIIMESDAPALSPKVTAYDLVLIQKHILGIEPFAEVLFRSIRISLTNW